MPKVGDTTAPRHLQEAAEYYRTAPGQHPNSTNKIFFTGENYAVLFAGFGQADKLLTQPLLLIAGSEAGSLWYSRELSPRLLQKAKDWSSSRVQLTWTYMMASNVYRRVTKKLMEFCRKIYRKKSL